MFSKIKISSGLFQVFMAGLMIIIVVGWRFSASVANAEDKAEEASADVKSDEGKDEASATEAKKEDSGKEEVSSSEDDSSDKSSEKKTKKDKKKKKKKKKDADKQANEIPPVVVDQAGGVGSAAINQLLANPDSMKETGIDAVLLLDSSGSMQREEREKIREHGAKIFVRLLSENDRVTVLQFDRVVKRLLDFTEVRPGNLPRIDRAIERVSSDGTHTDLEAPIRAALDILSKKARKNASTYIVLMSDGTMDPHPSRGTKESLTDQLINVDLPMLRRNAIRLFTVSIGSEADQKYLENIAVLTNGAHYHASNIGEAHENLSNIMLAIRNPIVSKPGGVEFEVSSDMAEATFFIQREAGEDDISILMPSGAEITSSAFPANVKWFRGGTFDIVTVSKPQLGNWTVSGVKNPADNVLFYSDFTVRLDWNHPTILLGDKIPVTVELLANGKPMSHEGFKRVIFLRYSIFSGLTGQLSRRGTLRPEKNPAGNDTDSNFSTIIEGAEEGSFRTVISFVAPTFTRTADFAYNVINSPFLLGTQKGNPDTHTPSKLTIRLGEGIKEYHDYSFKMVATNKETEKVTQIPVPNFAPGHDTIEIPDDFVAAGEYTVEAFFKGTNAEGHVVDLTPQSLTFVSYNEKVVTHAKAEVTEDHSHIWAIVWAVLSIVITLGGMGGVGFVVRKKFILTLETPVEETPFEVPEALTQELHALKDSASISHRAMNDKEVKMFEILKEPLHKPEAKAAKSSAKVEAVKEAAA